MSWLAHMELDAEIARSEGIFDSYGWHKKLWDCFPGTPDARRHFLTRIDPLEGAFRLWILSPRRPMRPGWCPSDCFASKEIAPSFFSHRFYAFDLRANPTKCLVQRDASGARKRQGKRIPLVDRDELREWLERKGRGRCRDQETGQDIPGGFRIVGEKPLEICPMVESHFRRNGQSGYHGGVQFRGILEVTDRERFVETYHSGIGSAKGFGFGMLLIAPVKISIQ